MKLEELTALAVRKFKDEEFFNAMVSKVIELGIEFKYNNDMKTSARLGIFEEEEGVLGSITVEVRTDLDPMIKAVSVAHELGHAWQFLVECEADTIEWRVYKIFNRELDIEKDAWVRAVSILKDVGFTQWSVFFKHAVRCYSTYIVVNSRNWSEDEDIRLKMGLGERIQFEKELKAEMSSHGVVYEAI